MGRDGGVQQFELLGLVTLHIGDEKWGRIRVQLENKDIRGVQLQTHPNVDKELFKLRSQVQQTPNIEYLINFVIFRLG